MPRTEHYLSKLRKKELADYVIFQLLYKDNTLTYKQARRIVGHAYNLLNERGGQARYDIHKRTAQIAVGSS